MEEIKPSKVVKAKSPKHIDKDLEPQSDGGTPPPPPDVPFEYQWIKLKNFFDLTDWDMNSGVEKRLKEVFDYSVRETKSQEFGNIEAHLRGLKTKLGWPDHGNTTLDKIWQYVRLSADIQDLTDQREKL